MIKEIFRKLARELDAWLFVRELGATYREYERLERGSMAQVELLTRKFGRRWLDVRDDLEFNMRQP